MAGMRRVHVGHSGAMLALAACVHEPPLAPPPPAPILAEVAPVTDAGTSPDQADPLADAPALLATFCTPVWAVHEDGVRRIACTTHGPWLTPPPDPTRNGTKAIGEHRGDPLEVCELGSFRRGSFTKAGANEWLVAFDECYETRFKQTKSAFTTIIEENDGRYRATENVRGVALEHCERAKRPEGRDFFYCEQTKTVEHVGTGTTYFVLDFGHTGRPVGTVATLMQHRFDCAWFQTSGGNRMPKGYAWMKPPSFHTRDGALLIDVERTYEAGSLSLDGRLGAECQRDPQSDGRPVLPPALKKTLVIEPTATSWAPAPETKELLDAWTKELNDYRLRGNLGVIWR